MQMNFETEREFNKKFPSGLYVCSLCGEISFDAYQCLNCGNQSNNFALYDKTLEYLIKDKGIKNRIFLPAELFTP